MTVPGRAIAVFAAGFLLLDAVLLLWAGLEQHRTGLVVGGAACAALAVAVVAMWRRYRRAMHEVEAGRREMRHQVESLRQLLKERHPSN